jgi:hypothetical protein
MRGCARGSGRGADTLSGHAPVGAGFHHSQQAWVGIPLEAPGGSVPEWGSRAPHLVRARRALFQKGSGPILLPLNNLVLRKPGRAGASCLVVYDVTAHVLDELAILS